MWYYQQLLEIGLVRIQYIADGTVWWVTRSAADIALASGKAVEKPLSKDELSER